MKKLARTAVLALIAMGAVAISLPAHASIAGSDPQPPPYSSSSSSSSVVLDAVLATFGV